MWPPKPRSGRRSSRPPASSWIEAARTYSRRTRTLARLRSRLRDGADLLLQRGDARLQRLVLFAREAGHILDRLEFLALDEIEITQNALGLIAHNGFHLALD